MVDWRWVHLGMFTGAFDASGKEGDPKTPCFVVAGFMGTADGWLAFEPEWRKRLGPLSVWESAQMARQRPDILRALVEMLPAFAIRKFSCSINLTNLKSVPDDIRKNLSVYAYPLCARILVTYVDTWAMKEHIPRERIAYVFEEGDQGQEELARSMVEDGYPRPEFRYKKDSVIKGYPHRGFTPLQAADILAWHYYQIHKGFINNPTTNREEILRRVRLPFEELENMAEAPRTITQEDLDSYITTKTYIDLRQRLQASQGGAPFRIQGL